METWCRKGPPRKTPQSPSHITRHDFFIIAEFILTATIKNYLTKIQKLILYECLKLISYSIIVLSSFPSRGIIGFIIPSGFWVPKGVNNGKRES